MSASAVLSPIVVKEVRALFPAWIACLVGVSAAALPGGFGFFSIGLLAGAVGAIAIGAQSIGHEYSNRTLGFLLAQPARRERLWLIKAGVLGLMLLTLGALASVVLANQHSAGVGRWIEQPVLAFPLLCGFFIAPWLTMLTRSPLAGMVFSVVLPPTLLIVGDVIGAAWFGIERSAEIDRFKLAVLWRGMFAVSAIAAVSSWRMFMRLEAIEGRGPEVRVPQWLRASPTIEAIGAAPARHRHAVWSILKKEIRLQQMTFVVAGLYILGLTGLLLMERARAISGVIPVGPLSILYFLLLSILIGSLASAEERQYGTLEWQLLLPMASWKQWLLKAGVALALALLLGVAVALGITSVLPFAGHGAMAPRGWLTLAGIVVILTSVALYVSSLSSSGVWAMVLSFPVILGGPMLANLVALLIGRTVYRSPIVLPVMVGTSLVLLLLRFGFLNHRSAERGVKRVWRQGLIIAISLTVLSILLAR